jgi:hypothetical protein
MQRRPLRAYPRSISFAIRISALVPTRTGALIEEPLRSCQKAALICYNIAPIQR